MELKRKQIIIISSIVVLLAVGLILIFSKNNCSSIKKRESRLKGLNGSNWQISQEVMIEDTIVSAIYSENLDGIAVFLPDGGKKYKYQSSAYIEKGNIVDWKLLNGEDIYHIFWLNKPNLNHAEIIFTVDGIQREPIFIRADSLKPIYIKAPEHKESYSFEIVYYDSKGKEYK